MVSISLKKHTALLSILIMLFLSLPGGNHDMFICVQPGGYIGFESVQEGCCEAPKGNAYSATDNSDNCEAESRDCDACVDIPLSGLENCVATGHAPELSRNMPATTISNRTLPGLSAPAASMPDSSHHKTRHLASFRSVTLRI